jgi:probable HAF family extracellular repeat protein
MTHAALARAVAALVAGLSVAGAPAASGQTAPAASGALYVMQDLNPPGGNDSRVSGINNTGQLAGYFYPQSVQQAYLLQAAIFTHTSIDTTLGTVSGLPHTVAFAINNLGQAVGLSTSAGANGGGVSHATLFANGRATDLGVLSGGSNSTAVAINTKGQVAGFSDVLTATNGGATHGALFANGKVTDLGALPDSPYSAATAINDGGQVVGYNIDVTNKEHAVMFANGLVIDLGTLPGDVTSIADGINNQGQVVGTSVGANGQAHAVMFANGKVTELAPGVSAGAQAINNLGDVVGGVDVAGGFSHAALIKNGQVIDLGTLPGLPASYAESINDNGQIAGWALDPGTGAVHAVLWLQATLSDLKTLFVTQQQYFDIDDEQSVNASLNHLHITALDPVSGNFQGSIWAPVLPPAAVPQVTLPVTGRITLSPTGTALGSFYGITFTWSYSGAACKAGSTLTAVSETASYTGAITFLGYQGSGKMHATIAGTVAPVYGDCALGKIALNPIPFSGQMVK